MLALKTPADLTADVTSAAIETMDAPSRMHQLSTKLTDISMSISAQNKARRSQIDAKIEELDRKIEGLHQQVAKLSFSLSAKIDSDHKV